MSQSDKVRYDVEGGVAVLPLVIAALNGHCVGGGLEVAMAADRRIAKQDGPPEVSLGVLPVPAARSDVGKSRAIDMMVSGTSHTVDEAVDWASSTKCSMATFVRARSRTRKSSFRRTARRKPWAPSSARSSGLEMTFESGLALERELQQQLFISADAKEGILAYVEETHARMEGPVATDDDARASQSDTRSPL